MATILIIDDDQQICEILEAFIRREGHRSMSRQTLTEGLQQLESAAFDLVFLDVGLPDGSGLELVRRIRSTPGEPEVVIITGAGDADGAEMAIKNGAWDYLQKPFNLKEITLTLSRALQYRENLKASSVKEDPVDSQGIIGSSPVIHDCLTTLAHAARNNASVLITGETGTGKELFARAVHNNSKRKENRFVVVDCAALPETLKESALFGHEKGAFTGAEKTSEGLVKQADGGTLFLDEVGEMDLPLQKVFLRVLQEKCYRPVGSRIEQKSDFRLVAATNRDLDKMVAEGTFRNDLLYRLRTVAIELPPLRMHPEDIQAIILYHTGAICRNFGIEPKGFSPDFFQVLCAYSWPGNIRELVNTLEGAISKAGEEPILFPMHLPDAIRVHVARANLAGDMPPQATTAYQVEKKPEGLTAVPPLLSPAPAPSPVLPSQADEMPSREEVLTQADQAYLKHLMRVTRGNIKEACQVSGLGRTRLYTLMKKYGISRLGWSTAEPEKDDACPSAPLE
ncbi:sigma-54-dependent transcriptional regulator [Desulfoluna butyratoxydans]|uniref:Signal transduction response regulator receiver domain n=1 Tax=Desulfoluna butyratoxydans TaxID=231438 RepID=A0A4U8YP19_9BACT|nr:sigma-54 dependent transcriptional regulator [Desulfoluna butyratoxydans]VFQ45560.1 signal transduction response regulator receiver domain [Desulfoluna butyratoxydans]